MRLPIVFIIAIVLLLMPAIAAASNDIAVVKPIAYAGAYGRGGGQIDTPLAVKVDAQDNVYVLQQVHFAAGKIKTSITVYDRNFTSARSFDVLKKSMSDVAWDRAAGGYYYDNLASAFDIDRNGTIYVLCGWDVVVFGKDGKYKYQFPVSSFMGWIDNTGGITKFYYPSALTVTDDGLVVITSGSTPQKHELIFIYPDGKLFTKLELPAGDITQMFGDGSGRIYLIEKGSSVVRSYDRTFSKEMDLSLYFNGTYTGSPTGMAFFSTGNFTASANGIFIYEKNGSMRTHFMDNNLSANNMNWGRPVATNSSDWLIVVSGMNDAPRTPKPILLYKYVDGGVVGEPEKYDTCGSVFALFGGAAVLYFCVRRF